MFMINILMLQETTMFDPDDMISDDIPCMGDDPSDDSLEPEDECREDQFNSDAEADADVLASAGWGTDEDYRCFGGCEE
jgi:hypothetical protein